MFPREWRLKLRARTDTERLDWFIRTLVAHLGETVHNPRTLAPEDAEVFVVATAWMRRALSYSRAVSLLIAHDEIEATPPVERALLEVVAELAYLIRHGDPRENAARVRAAAAFEYYAFAVEQGYDRASAAFREAEELVERRRREHPGMIAEMELARSKGRFHWSGLSRTRLGTIALGPTYRTIYGMLSWDAHPVVTALRDFSATETGATFSREWLDDDAKDQLASRVGGTMVTIWAWYAETFGLETFPAAVRRRLRRVGRRDELFAGDAAEPGGRYLRVL
jgi:hypothetical protein